MRTFLSTGGGLLSTSGGLLATGGGLLATGGGLLATGGGLLATGAGLLATDAGLLATGVGFRATGGGFRATGAASGPSGRVAVLGPPSQNPRRRKWPPRIVRSPWVHFDRGAIRITPREAWQPKSNKPREVPISDALTPWLTRSRRSDVWLFPSRKGERYAVFPEKQWDASAPPPA